MWFVISHIVLYVNGTLWFSDWEWSHNVPIHTLWFQRGSKTEHAISRPDWCSTGKLSLLKSHIHYMWKRKFYMWMILCDFRTGSDHTTFLSTLYDSNADRKQNMPYRDPTGALQANYHFWNHIYTICENESSICEWYSAIFQRKVTAQYFLATFYVSETDCQQKIFCLDHMLFLHSHIEIRFHI